MLTYSGCDPVASARLPLSMLVRCIHLSTRTALRSPLASSCPDDPAGLIRAVRAGKSLEQIQAELNAGYSGVGSGFTTPGGSVQRDETHHALLAGGRPLSLVSLAFRALSLLVLVVGFVALRGVSLGVDAALSLRGAHMAALLSCVRCRSTHPTLRSPLLCDAQTS